MNAARLLVAACFIGSVIANTTLIAGEWLRVDQPSIPGVATLVYDPTTGELNINGGGRALRTYGLESANWLFDRDIMKTHWDCWWNIVGESWCARQFIFLDALGSAAAFPPGYSLGVGIYPIGLSWDEVAGDLSAGGSFKDAPRQITQHGLYVVPEPSGLCLILASVVGLAMRRGQRR